MDKQLNRKLDEMLISLFNHVMDVEGKVIITEEFKDITNNDMHVIDAVGIDEAMNMSAIAKKLSVTLGTLTTSMNGLENKGYIIRERNADDKRVVFVKLTEKGKKAYYHHRNFHRNMIKAVVRGLDDDEKKMLYKCLVKLDAFFSVE